MARLAALPGVKSVSLDRVPAGNGIITLLDQGGTGPKQYSNVPLEEIPSTFLDTIGTPLVLGRGFTADEVNAHTPVLIVSESTARNLWPGENALGKLLRVEQPMRDGSTKMIFSSSQLVGVARDNQIYRSGETLPLIVYLPGAAPGELDTKVLVRTTTDAASLKDLVRREAFAVEPVLRLFVKTFEERIAGEQTIISAASHGATALTIGVVTALLMGVTLLACYLPARRATRVDPLETLRYE